MLSRVEQDKLWEVYVPGQEDRMDPTDAYLRVTRKLIELVGERELVKSMTRGELEAELVKANSKIKRMRRRLLIKQRALDRWQYLQSTRQLWP